MLTLPNAISSSEAPKSHYTVHHCHHHRHHHSKQSYLVFTLYTSSLYTRTSHISTTVDLATLLLNVTVIGQRVTVKGCCLHYQLYKLALKKNQKKLACSWKLARWNGRWPWRPLSDRVLLVLCLYPDKNIPPLDQTPNINAELLFPSALPRS